MGAYSLSKGTRYNKDQSIITYNILFGGLTTAIYKV